jgi:hypothetical protein
MRLHNTSNPRRAAAILAAGVSLAAPASAAAIDPGVNYDPGSPAGKEYAIPLVEGRSEGAGTANQRAGANIPFGVGITPPGSGGSGKSGPGGGGGGPAKAGHGRGARGGGANGKAGNAGKAQTAADRSALESRLADAESAGGTAGRTLGIAAAVLLAAALLGVALRRRQGPQAA